VRKGESRSCSEMIRHCEAQQSNPQKYAPPFRQAIAMYGQFFYRAIVAKQAPKLHASIQLSYCPRIGRSLLKGSASCLAMTGVHKDLFHCGNKRGNGPRILFQFLGFLFSQFSLLNLFRVFGLLLVE
jgi:hypothetical protein